MKNKIITILIAVLTISSCVSFGVFGASAHEFNGVELPSIENYKDDTRPYMFILKDGITYYLYLSSTPATYTVMTEWNFHQFKVHDRIEYKLILDWETLKTSTGLDYVQKSRDEFTFVWSNHDIYDHDNTKVIFKGTEIKGKCDGSSCPATDVNTDNICDDCGMVFAVLRDYPIPDPYSVFTTEYQTRFPYAFIYKGENNVYHMIFSALEPVYFNGAVVVENNEDDLTYLKYSVNGDTWKYDGGFSDGADIVTDTVYPSFNMNDLDGNLAFKQNTDFFPIPLWVEMDNLTQGEMVQFSPTMVGILITLTVCGVGCLALLVVLKLFGKRSLLYRK